MIRRYALIARFNATYHTTSKIFMFDRIPRTFPSSHFSQLSGPKSLFRLRNPLFFSSEVTGFHCRIFPFPKISKSSKLAHRSFYPLRNHVSLVARFQISFSLLSSGRPFRQRHFDHQLMPQIFHHEYLLPSKVRVPLLTIGRIYNRSLKRPHYNIALH